mmetsp:Transcript_101321/g.158279  ORF Transcript_101321/g.158279 Transcript_101321/m.158279 type:complete len:232 (+) Transcript_101321:77-772(+)
MIRTLSPDDFVRESSQALEKANHVIATVRISKVYLVFCAIMSFLSSALLMYSMWKLARHGVSSIKVDPVEEFMELAVCGGILVEVLWALRLLPLQLFMRVKLLQLDICVFVMASLSAALASANLAEYFASSSYEAFEENTAMVPDSHNEDVWRGVSSALFLFRFLLQPTRAILAMRNAWQLTRERKVAMEDIVLPDMPATGKDVSPIALLQMNGAAGSNTFMVNSSEAGWV